MRNYIILILVLSTAMLKASDFIIEEKIEFKNINEIRVFQDKEIFLISEKGKTFYNFVNKFGDTICPSKNITLINYSLADFGLDSNSKFSPFFSGFEFTNKSIKDTVFTFINTKFWIDNLKFDIKNNSKKVYYFRSDKSYEFMQLDLRTKKSKALREIIVDSSSFPNEKNFYQRELSFVKYSEPYDLLFVYLYIPSNNGKDSITDYLLALNNKNQIVFKKEFKNSLNHGFYDNVNESYMNIEQNKLVFSKSQINTSGILERANENLTYLYDLNENKVIDSIMENTGSRNSVLPNNNILYCYYNNDTYGLGRVNLKEFKTDRIYTNYKPSWMQDFSAQIVTTFNDFENYIYLASPSFYAQDEFTVRESGFISRYRFKPLSIENVKDELVKIYNSNIISQVDVNKIYVSDYTVNSVEFSSVEDANNYISRNKGIQLIKVICGNKHYNFKIAK